MVTKRDVLVFFGGAAFFHTINHLMLPYFFKLPLEIQGISFTETMNTWTIIGSAVLTVALLWGAFKSK